MIGFTTQEQHIKDLLLNGFAIGNVWWNFEISYPPFLSSTFQVFLVGRDELQNKSVWYSIVELLNVSEVSAQCKRTIIQS